MQLARLLREHSCRKDRVIGLCGSLVFRQLLHVIRAPRAAVLGIVYDRAAFFAVVNDNVSDIGAGCSFGDAFDSVRWELSLQSVKQVDLRTLTSFFSGFLL